MCYSTEVCATSSYLECGVLGDKFLLPISWKAHGELRVLALAFRSQHYAGSVSCVLHSRTDAQTAATRVVATGAFWPTVACCFTAPRRIAFSPKLEKFLNALDRIVGLALVIRALFHGTV